MMQFRSRCVPLILMKMCIPNKPRIRGLLKIMQLSFHFVHTQLQVCQRPFSSHTYMTFVHFFREVHTYEEVHLSIVRHPAA